MLALDTNVISEAMKGPAADSRVISWLRRLSAPPVTTVINRAEILAGIALLPAGARRDRLRTAALAAFSTLGVTLPLAPEAADHYAEIVATRRNSGRPIGGMDALVAAICRMSGATLVTRDTRHERLYWVGSPSDQSLDHLTDLRRTVGRPACQVF